MDKIRTALHATDLDWTDNDDQDTVEVRAGGLLVVIGEATTETGDAADGYDATAYASYPDDVAWSAHYQTASDAVDALSAL